MYWQHRSASAGQGPATGGEGPAKQANRDCATERNARTSSARGRSSANRAQSQHEALPAKSAAMDSLTPTAPKSSATSCVGGWWRCPPPAPQKRISLGAGLWAACWLALCLVGICVLLALCLAGSLPGWPCWLALCRMVAASVPGWLCGCNAMFSDRPCARTSLCLPGSVPGWLCACSAMFSNWLCPSPCRAEPRSRPYARTRARLPMLPRKRCP